MKRRDIAAALALAATLGRAWGGNDPYPNRPIRMVVGTAAGSGTDILARVLAEKLGRLLGQTVIVDNKPGSNGILANGDVAASKPDGYTLLLCGFSSMVANPWFYKKLPYRPLADFAPIAQIGAGGNLLLVNPRLPIQDVHDLVEWARAQKATPLYATWGVGSSAHAAMEQLMHTSGVKFEHVVYKSIPQLLQDLVGGQIDIGWADPMSPLPLINQGSVRALAVASTARAPRLPNVPTLLEQKIPMNLDGWYGLFVRHGTQVAIIMRLHELVAQISREAEFIARLHALNVNVSQPGTPEQFTALMKNETQRWGELARQMGVEPQ
ncbi:Bug family tripartite tricarboxylate transporter substrate binding protein [Variovorax sp. M-6]|uniref:Bug family tripartite tricarboxylate transporter substrate binding protein n=1 Tax=Variovorax sp. M-6 TaxID=3233041 RepID=UPI003F96424A